MCFYYLLLNSFIIPDIVLIVFFLIGDFGSNWILHLNRSLFKRPIIHVAQIHFFKKFSRDKILIIFLKILLRNFLNDFPVQTVNKYVFSKFFGEFLNPNLISLFMILISFYNSLFLGNFDSHLFGIHSHRNYKINLLPIIDWYLSNYEQLTNLIVEFDVHYLIHLFLAKLAIIVLVDCLVVILLETLKATIGVLAGKEIERNASLAAENAFGIKVRVLSPKGRVNSNLEF